jgi:hypothetical protein
MHSPDIGGTVRSEMWRLFNFNLNLLTPAKREKDSLRDGVRKRRVRDRDGESQVTCYIPLLDRTLNFFVASVSF